MIEIRDLTKRFGRVLAVDDLSFDVHPGRVTGFLGPNGSGKSTTMRCMLGLDRPERGATTFDGKCVRVVRASRCTRSARCSTPATSIPAAPVATTCAGWRPRNGLPRRASTRCSACRAHRRRRPQGPRLLAGHAPAPRPRRRAARRPAHVILDEPANGLDPEGIRWIRDVLVHLARQGRTILVSSHLLSEIALMADDLVVIGRGRLIEQGPVGQFIDRHADRWVRVRTPAPGRRSPSSCAAPARTYSSRSGPTASRSTACRSSTSASSPPARRRAPRAVATDRVAGGRLPQGDRRRPGVPLGAHGVAAPTTAAAVAPARRREAVVIDAIRSEWIKVSTVTVDWVLVDHRRRLPARRRRSSPRRSPTTSSTARTSPASSPACRS